MPLTLQSLIQAIEKAKAGMEIGNCDDGCCPEYANLVNADILIQELKKMEEYDFKRSGTSNL